MSMFDATARLVRNNQTVATGQVLVELETEDLATHLQRMEAERAGANAALSAARAQLALRGARADEARAEAQLAGARASLDLLGGIVAARGRLDKANGITERLEVARGNVARAEAELARAEARTKLARRELEQAAIRAPTACSVGRLSVEAGQVATVDKPMLKPGMGAEISVLVADWSARAAAQADTACAPAVTHTRAVWSRFGSLTVRFVESDGRAKRKSD